MKTKLIVLLGVLGVSFSAIFVKYATAPSAVLAFYRMGFTTLCLLPVVLLKHREELKKLTSKNILWCMVSGFFLACHFTCYFESIRYTSVSSSTVLVDTEVFFICIFSYLLFREKCSRSGLLGIAITFGGSVVLAMADRSGGSAIIKGDSLALMGACFMAIYTMIGSRQRKGLSTTVYTFFVYGTTSITLFLFNLVTKTPVYGYGGMNYLWGFLLCIFCTLMGHSIFNWGLKYLPTALISNMKLGEPVFASILALFLFGQVPGIQQIIGGILVIVGIYIYLKNANSIQEDSTSPQKEAN